MLITNIGRLITMESGKGREGELGVIKNAVLEIEDGRIKKNTGDSSLHSVTQNDILIDAKGCVVLPGLIDCHTHLVHASNRADEFAMRARGMSYEDIAKAGGGIMSTVKATRAASEDELFALAKERADEALSYGITTLEVKSGYGLDLNTELKMLRVVKRLGKASPQDFVPTFLAHAISPYPSPFRHTAGGQARGEGKGGGERSKFIKIIINEIFPAIAKEKLAGFCDCFVEEIAFTAVEAEKILKAAVKYGLKLKLHADQLSSNGGAVLSAKLKAVSADHLEHVAKKDIFAMAKAGVTAVLIPSSTFFIGGKYAPAREMIDAGIDVAVSTDYNPGTSPILNLWLAATMAITQMKLTVAEAYKGITINAARALSLEKTHGSIKVGKAADLVILDAKNEVEPFYRFDKNFVSKVIKNGKVVYER